MLSKLFQESSKVLGAAKKLFRGVQGVENIYTQHVPTFKSIIENVCRNRSEPRLSIFGANPQASTVSFLIIRNFIIA